MPLSELARSRLAELAGGRGRRILPTKRMPRVKCPACGWEIFRSSYRKTCVACTRPMPPKPPYLCRLCEGPCPGRRSSWCSDECFDAYSLATDSAWLRSKVEKRDKGVCATCGLDCHALQSRVNAMGYEQRGEAFVVLRENGFNVPLHRASFCGSLWECHHHEPLDEGGSWELYNVITLCTPEHKEKTAEQAMRRGKQQRLIGRKWRRTQEMLRLSQGGA